MRPGSIGSPSTAFYAGGRPARSRMRGRTLVAEGGTWTTISTAAARSVGSCATSWLVTSTPPADAPITIRLEAINPHRQSESGAAPGGAQLLVGNLQIACAA